MPKKCPGQRRRNDGGARPRSVETTGERVSFRPRNIFPHIFACCSLNFHSVVMLQKILTQKTQAYATHKACLCHKQDGKLLRVL